MCVRVDMDFAFICLIFNRWRWGLPQGGHLVLGVQSRSCRNSADLSQFAHQSPLSIIVIPSLGEDDFIEPRRGVSDSWAERWKEGKAEECVKDTWIESNESREEHRHVFHLQADLNRSFIIIIWKMCMLIAQRHLPAGRKDTLHFQRIYSHFPGPAVFESRARSH